MFLCRASGNRFGGVLAVVVVAAALLCVGAAHAGQDYVMLGPSDNFALDQPRVAVELVDNGQSIGPFIANTFLLDTGAQGILAVGYAVEELELEGYQTVGTFNEIGVGGSIAYDVSAMYDFRFAGSPGWPIVTIPDAQILSDPAGNFGGFAGIVGMPGMVDRVTELDLTAMTGGSFGFDLIGVQFHDALPSGNGHRYEVPLTLVNFPPAGEPDPTNTLPTYAPLPFANVKTRHNDMHASGSFLIDTGAQVSFISTETAIALGMDTNGNGIIDLDTAEGEALGTTEISGVGGPQIVPVVAMDRLAVPTSQGTDLVWSDLEVIVLDIATGPGEPTINGIFGSDLLTSGWLNAVFGFADSGFIEQTYFDFLDAAAMSGSMVLDIYAPLDVVQTQFLPGDYTGDGLVNTSDYTTWADAFGWTGPPGGHPADGNSDGVIDTVDYVIWADHFNDFVVGLPEPGVLALLTAALPLLLWRRANRPRSSRHA